MPSMWCGVQEVLYHMGMWLNIFGPLRIYVVERTWQQVFFHSETKQVMSQIHGSSKQHGCECPPRALMQVMDCKFPLVVLPHQAMKSEVDSQLQAEL